MSGARDGWKEAGDETTRRDIYQRVSDRILELLDLGIPPSATLWDRGGVTIPVRWNGEAYRGINIIMLWMESFERGYALPTWMTFKQAQALGGRVRKGEKSSPVVKAGSITKTEDNGAGEEVEREIHFLKSYAVFNAAQIDGLEARFYVPPEKPRLMDLPDRLTHVREFVNNTGV